MLTPQITIPQWLALPIEVRTRLKAIFNIPRSKGTELLDNKVVSDGHTHPDLARITLEAMKEYLNAGPVSEDDDFFAVLNAVLNKVTNDIEVEKANTPAPVAPTPAPVEMVMVPKNPPANAPLYPTISKQSKVSFVPKAVPTTTPKPVKLRGRPKQRGK